MESLKVLNQQIYAAISPIRNALTWTVNQKYFAFASLNDICFAKAQCLEDYSSKSIVKTLPLNKKPACLAFAKSDTLSNKDVLFVVDGDGRLLAFDVVQNGEDDISIEVIDSGEKSEYPSDFCLGHIYQNEVIVFFCRRNILFCRKRGDSTVYQYKFTADVKCFDSIAFNDSFFCVVGTTNGNVHFFETKVKDLNYFALVGLVSPFPIPVLNVVVQKLDNFFICAFNHATKVTAVRWEQVSEKSDASELKICRELNFAGKSWYMSTDTVLSDFTTDISALKFDATGKKLLIVTNDRDFGVYEFKKDSENQNEYAWLNLVRGGEAKERPFGYCGGSFSANGNRILIYQTKGIPMLFDLVEQSKDFYLSVEASPPFTGHTSAISATEFDPTGNLLFTAGTRSREIHIIAKLKDGSYAQISRPESHQYDVRCLVPLSGLTMAVGSDELPFRIYKAPSSYCDSVKALTGLSPEDLRKRELQLPTVPFFKQPVLGVLNIAAGDAEEGEDVNEAETVFEKRPTTNQILRFTFWEVAESLYGHANSASAVSTDQSCEWIATSCQATSSEDAVILIRKVNDWNIEKRIHAHQLTVTKLAYSPNSKHLLSVSRDRSFAVTDIDEKSEWNLRSCVSEAHSRMILACSWTPDSKYFVTAGRDAQFSFWPSNAEKVQDKILTEKLVAPIMALDIAPHQLSSGKWLIAAGLSNGEIHFYALSSDINESSAEKVVSLGILKNEDAFSLAITTLKFQPMKSVAVNTITLVAGSESGIIKVFELKC